jgi:hypothetical protein
VTGMFGQRRNISPCKAGFSVQWVPARWHGKPQRDLGIAVINPNLALQDFKVTSNYDAEFAAGAGTMLLKEIGRGEWIRTTDLLVPNQAL